MAYLRPDIKHNFSYVPRPLTNKLIKYLINNYHEDYEPRYFKT